MKKEIQVNGVIHKVDVEDDMPLLYVLRDILSLKGTKYSCGKGFCGNCLVHLDKRSIFSCQVPVSNVSVNQNITTIEGIRLNPGELHPLQKLWLEHDVAQCGYCQPAQIMAALALLDNNPAPTEQEIDSAMSKVLCRCGSYPDIKSALHSFINNSGLKQK